MKPIEIVALSVRFFALVVAIYAIRNGISLSPFFYNQGWQKESFIYAAIMVFLIFLSVCLWKFPLTIAKGLINFQEKEPSTNISPVNAEQLQVIAFTVLGLYFLFFVLSDIIHWLVIWFISQRNIGTQIEISLEQKAQMFSTVFELIFVLFLLFGAKGISRLIKKLKYA